MEGEVTQMMASILKSTDSAYYPSFRNMFDKVVSALVEAMDITLYLKPLSEHFEVFVFCSLKVSKTDPSALL